MCGIILTFRIDLLSNMLHDFFDSQGYLLRLAMVAYEPLFALGGRPKGSKRIKTF